MNKLKDFRHSFCRITVYNYEENATIKYDGWISMASDTAVHLTHVNGRSGTYIFEYSRIKKATVYKRMRDLHTGVLTEELLFVCYQ